MPAGRPSLKTPEVCNSIVERIANGEPLAQICRDEGMPHWRTVYDWMDADAELSAAIARARDHGADVIALEALAIADERIEDPASRRVMVDTRLKLLAKWNPKKYGDAVTVKGDKDNPLPVEHRLLTPEKLATLSDATVAEIASLAPDAS